LGKNYTEVPSEQSVVEPVAIRVFSIFYALTSWHRLCVPIVQEKEVPTMRWIHSVRLGVLVGIPIVMTASLSGLVRADEPAFPTPAAKAADSDIRVRTTHVREVQLALLAAGYHPGPIDGIMGPRTKAALRQYIAVPPPQVPSRPEWTLAPPRMSEPRETP